MILGDFPFSSSDGAVYGTYEELKEPRVKSIPGEEE